MDSGRLLAYARAPETEEGSPVKKTRSHRNRNRSSRYRAKLKQKHRRARRRQTGGSRPYYR